VGVRFLDARGRELREGGGSLVKLATIDSRGIDPRLKTAEIQVACDVDNPLFGTRGAAHVYGPQKGATPAMVQQLDAGLRRLAAIIQKDLGLKVAHVPGAGAAGGAGAGLMAFLNGHLFSGADLVLAAVDLEAKLADCDLVITGEGRLDGQTAFGKAPAKVAQMANRRQLPVVAICGSLGPDTRKLRSLGIDACFSALKESMDEAALPARAPKMLEECAEQVGRLLQLGNFRGV
jgi:glycerate kinase